MLHRITTHELDDETSAQIEALNLPI